MRYVLIRDDDTNASTPIECLETLYRPWLDRGMPVNLALIPEVTLAAHTADGRKEQFLFNTNGDTSKTLPIAQNRNLVRYLLDNPGYHILQHGHHHDYLEFDRQSSSELGARIERGVQRLAEAGFRRAETFVAPYDKISRAAYRLLADQFNIISTGWFERRRLPPAWWPKYALKEWRAAPHWRVGHTLLLSHPGCLLSCYRDYRATFPEIISHVNAQPVTVLVTHWWEYFRDGKTDHTFLSFLHEVLDYLSSNREIKVIPFSALITERIDLN
jgi:predicted deacetylase